MTRPSRTQAGKEAVIICILAAIVFWLSSTYDLMEKLLDFTRDHESLELDESLATFIFLAFALCFFAVRRWLELRDFQRSLLAKNRELEAAANRITRLEGIIPICSACKKIRDDEGYWQQVELYVQTHSQATFSHSLCPDCMERHYGNEVWFDKIKESN